MYNTKSVLICTTQLIMPTQHFEDLLAIYEEHKRERNVLVAHCYGCIHVLRLLKHLSGLNRLGEVSGLVVMALGSNTPAGGSSSKVISKLPAFILGSAAGNVGHKIDSLGLIVYVYVMVSP